MENALCAHADFLDSTLERVEMMEKRKMMAAALLPAIMIVLVGYLSFRLHEANEYLRDRIYYSSVRLNDYLMLMRAMKKEHPPERDYVKRFNNMLNADGNFLEFRALEQLQAVRSKMKCEAKTEI